MQVYKSVSHSSPRWHTLWRNVKISKVPLKRDKYINQVLESGRSFALIMVILKQILLGRVTQRSGCGYTSGSQLFDLDATLHIC